jgi:hypothetical protein
VDLGSLRCPRQALVALVRAGGTFKKGVLVESPADQAADESGEDQQVA